MRSPRRTFLAGSAAGLASLAVVGPPARAAQFEFKAATNLSEDHPAVIRMNQMWAAIEKESGGRIHVEFFPNSQLGGDAAMFSQLRLGALHFMLVSAANLASIIPPAEIMYLGFAFKDPDEAIRAMGGSLTRYLGDEASAKGLFMLPTLWDSGMYQIGANPHPIRTPDDLSDFKIRVPATKIFVDLFKSLGGNPSTLDTKEIYTGLQTKIIDGETSPLVSIESQRWYEVNKYISLTNHAWTGYWIAVNADVWRSLPPDLQSVVERNNVKHATLERRDTKQVNASVGARLRSQGCILNDVDQAPFRARLQSYYQSWAAVFGPTEWGLLQDSLGHRLI